MMEQAAQAYEAEFVEGAVAEQGWVAVWNGGEWCLCHGTWELFHDGQRVNTAIPFQGRDAGTFGTYSYWFFGGESGWDEQWEDYEDGLATDAWCEENREWLATIAPREEWPEIFWAFQSEDFRPGSCGGCI